VSRARFLALDLIGNIVRTRHDAESTTSFLAATRARWYGSRQFWGVRRCGVLYSRRGGPPEWRAGPLVRVRRHPHAAGSSHPGAPVIQMAGASGADVLAAIIAEYEVTCRVALALPAAEHHNRG
jgi:hypothetical protein